MTDATSLVEIHAFLIYLCDCAIRGAPAAIAEQRFPETIDDAVARCLTVLQLGSEGAAEGFDYATGWLMPHPNGSVTIYEGRLVANTAFVEDVTPAPLIALLTEGVLRALRLCKYAMAQVD